MDNIFRLIQQETGVNRDEIVGVKRDDRVLIGRILFIIYCKFYQELSYSKIGRLINRDLENGMVEIVKLEYFMSYEDIRKKHGKAIFDKYSTDGPHMARANDSEEVTVRTKTFAIHEMRNGQSLGAAYFKTDIEDMKEAGANLVKCIREARAAEKKEKEAKRMAEIKVIEI